MAQQTAVIEAQRDDRKGDFDGFDNITAAIQNPHGHFPTEAFHEAQEVVGEMDIQIPDKTGKVVAEVVYDGAEDSNEYTINVL